MSIFWQSPSGIIEETCDIVIIGSGPGGSIAALTLAEAGLDVLLIEKGQAMTPSNMPKTIRHAVKDWYAEAAFRTSNGNTPCPVAGGEGLGGGTLVNSALCFSRNFQNQSDVTTPMRVLYVFPRTWGRSLLQNSAFTSVPI